MLADLPMPVDFCAWTAALYNPGTHRAIAGAGKGYASDESITFEATEEFTGGDDETKESGCGKAFFTRVRPECLKWAKGDLVVGRGHPEWDALITGAGLYVPTTGAYIGKTTGFSMTPDDCPQQYVCLSLYFGLELDNQVSNVAADASSATASITNADATVTVADTSVLRVGQGVTGTGIPALAKILSITDGTHFELTANATATNAAVVLTFAVQYANAWRVWFLPKCLMRPRPGGLKKGPHDMKYEITAFPERPAVGYTGPFGELPADYFTQITKTSWGYAIDVAAPPTIDTRVLLTTA